MADELRARTADVTMAPLEFTDEHFGRRFQSVPMKWPIAKIVGMYRDPPPSAIEPPSSDRRRLPHGHHITRAEWG
jgi:hypothetical protein